MRLEVSPVMRNSRPKPCSSQHGRPKCNPSNWRGAPITWLWRTASDALVDVYLWRRASPLCREYNINQSKSKPKFSPTFTSVTHFNIIIRTTYILNLFRLDFDWQWWVFGIIFCRTIQISWNWTYTLRENIGDRSCFFNFSFHLYIYHCPY